MKLFSVVRALLLGVLALGSAPALAQNIYSPGNAVFGGSITATGMSITGTVAADSACTGCVGEYQTSSTVSGFGAATATAVNVGSIALTAGDWDCRGNVVLSAVAGANGTTLYSAWTTTVSATAPTPTTGPTGGSFSSIQTASINLTSPYALSLAPARYNFSSTTTVFLSAQSTFSGGSNATYFGFLGCRRVR